MSAAPDGKYEGIVTGEQLDEVINTILKNNITDIGIDTETDSLDYLNCNILGVSLAYNHNNINYGFYIPVRRRAEQLMLWDSPDNYLTLDDISSRLNLVLDNPYITKYLHNAKFDMHILKRHGFVLDSVLYDSMIGACILGNVAGARFGLKHLVKKHLGFDMLEFSQVTGKNKDFSDVPLVVAVDYAGPDGDMTLRLSKKELDIFNKFPELKPTLDLELKCIPILQEMEETGAKIDRDFLVSAGKALQKDMNTYLKKIYSSFHKKFNVNSEDQLLDVLKSELNVSLPNVQAKTLESLTQTHPSIQHILDYRKRLKLKSVYVDGMLDKLDKDDRVHTDFYQMLATGRLSSNNPNLQNIPTKKDDDDIGLPLIRKAFVANDGYKFVSIDYSQLELRVITHVANESYWINAFANDEDIHLSTAAAVLKKDLSEVTKYERKTAKFTNFGLLYGESAYGLSNRTGMSKEDADDFIYDYFSVLPNIKKYTEDIKHQVTTRRYTETFNGRRLYYTFDPNDWKSIAKAIRRGTNQPIQGGAADIVKKAMVEVADILRGYRTKLILQVHDELNFEMYVPEMPVLIPKIIDVMTGVFQLRVPLKVDVEYGDNWNDLTDWTE